jgi:hypothetical protein
VPFALESARASRVAAGYRVLSQAKRGEAAGKILSRTTFAFGQATHDIVA